MIQQTISFTVEKALQAHETACTQEIAAQMADLQIQASEPEEKPYKLTEAEKKQLVEKIRSEAERNATKWDGETRKLNQFSYEQALPTDAEFNEFVYLCEQHRLNPLMNQIYFQKRKGRALHIISIDSYRLKADRARGKGYTPSKATEYFDGKHAPYYGPTPHHCITHCKKQTTDGTWHDFEQIAFFEEYKQTYGDSGKLTPMWQTMGATMLEKCCEAKMLRKGWPDEFGGLYISEELDQATNNSPEAPREGGNSAKEALSQARAGAANKGHGSGDTVRGGKKKEPAKTEPLPATIEVPIISAPYTITDKHDKEVLVQSLTGWVSAFRNTNSEGTLLKTANNRPFVTVEVAGLSTTDQRKDPHGKFQCYHPDQHEALEAAFHKKVVFNYSKSVDQGTKKAENKGAIWQSIEQVLQIGETKYRDGKPLRDELDQTPPVKAEDENQDAEPAPENQDAEPAVENQDAEPVGPMTPAGEAQYAELCKLHKLDPAAMHNGAPRYEMSAEGELFDRETGDVYTAPAPKKRGKK